MKISELVKKLNQQKKALGDVEVMIDLKNIEVCGGHQEYSHESYITLVPEKIQMMNMDTEKLSRKKEQILSIRIHD